MPRRDYIGKALGDAFALLGQAYGQRIQKNAYQEQLQNELGNLLNQKDQIPRPDRGFAILDESGQPISYGTGYTEQPRPVFSEQNLPQIMNLLNHPAGQQAIQLLQEMQPKWQTWHSDKGGLQGVPLDMQGRPIGSVRRFGGGVDMTGAGDLPEGFAQITDPARKAEIWNKTYGTNLTAKDFENIQERPYYTQVRTPQGYKIFNARTGKYEEPPAGQKPPLLPLPPEAVKELSDAKTTYDRLTTVSERAEKLKDKFGPIEGRWNNLKVKFVGEGATQEVINELRSLITIAYSLSGKQISYREMEILQEAMLPRLEQPYENFSATLNFAKSWLANTHDNRLQYYEDSGYGGTLKKLGTGGGPKKKTIRLKSGVEVEVD